LIVVVGQTESVAVEDVPISPDAQSGGATATVPPAIPPKNNALRTWGYVSLGSTAALGIAGVATYLEFSSTRSTFDAGGDAVGSLHSTAAAYRTATYALWGLGLACGVTGVVLLAIPNSRSSRTMGFGIGPGAAFFRGSF
jgi:hypothetical protein